MKKKLPNLEVNPLDNLFSTEEERQEDKLEKIINLHIGDIHEFSNHPFGVRMDDDMQKLIDSVSQNGVLLPVLVRPSKDGKGYEMISGHRRMKAIELNNMSEIPAIVRNLDDDQATIIMVDSNIQRENILPSERGFAYKMKLEAMKHQGKRTDLTSMQLAYKSKLSVEILGEEVGQTKDQIRRYIRLTALIKPLRDLVDGIREDGKKIAFNPAVELSYLTEENQKFVVKYIDDLESTPSHAQTIRMKELSKQNRLDENVIYSIMTEEKANQKEKISFKMDEIKDYFPKDYTPRQMNEVVIKLLKKWAKNRNQEQSR
ncbi:ParB/RepB/Spo0J family partition protein [Thomasclavelia spiroformis]|uniref:ParB/RepB/Spo0J family partition protein n=1 Tax=Thomasclavelia spiroformis TaxID=29348 RepID=UPI00255B513D|nr:ParB/RepB/Spo0J family partition protein [Thomasclavelia spiroformis]